MLKSFFASTAIALSLSLAPISAFAEPEPIHPETISPEKLALIEELRVLTKRDENATQVLDIMMSQMQDQASAMSKSLFGEAADPTVIAAFDETFTRIVERMYTLMQAEIDFAAVQEDIDFKLYNEYYSAAELADLIAFYKTPTGQKTAEIYPQLAQRSMELFSAEVTPTMMEIQQQVLMEELSAGFEMMPDYGAPESEEEYDTQTNTDETTM
ncbi:DUF2059 domain-containing protein [[Limnothrix rosea] IAM M-220]|uniref:DUF2059 domain-containing protein n=1 Tax=[Limnothrix rosea] IAM M-220 TaxID=454133 RepID=UPI000958E981|nr:DUF2059 domain-containing protein [[Limnothrix rosea] IAM M-220]OKH18607.1 hypothetical protein NIES208_05210 [[Limnothrix rosea] IAM M-220]